MGRVYYAPFNITAFGTASGDILQITAGTNKPIAIHRFDMGQVDSEVNEMLHIQIVRATGAGTTGGTTPTGEPLVPNDAADGAALLAGYTSDATSLTTMWQESWSSLAAYKYVVAPEDRIIVASAGILVFKVADTPTGDFDLAGTLTYEELV